MLRRNVFSLAVLSILVGAVFVMIFSMQTAEAGPIWEVVGTEYWMCVRGSDSHTCDSKSREYRDKHEPFSHWINPFVHPHDPNVIDGPDRYSGQVVTYCSECDPPSW